jgi:mono/diheme cytochrome c family protein
MKKLALFALVALAPLTGRAADGKKIFLENCTSCHGEDGKADTELGRKNMAQDLTDPKLAKELTPAKTRKVIERGVPDTKMKGWKGELKPDEIEAVAGYVTSTFLTK